ncbi:hypothetical protein KI387_017125 [Taxus chinensis]|uniref:DNA-directed RNA polymerase subunit n=1 Tax=Taxus chinensis TaxID=29808 RepID=A0AA38GGF5_TAXCH|nr:hypothetical protein KI387_017125 [Taxus chinensis]
MDSRFPYSPAEVAKVKVVQFGILSPNEIRGMSAAQIEYCETYEHGKPKLGGLNDPRLGSIDCKMRCETCSAGMIECPGHFGHLELAKPIYHIGFLKTILSILRCVCFNCSRILADEGDHRFKQALKVKNPKHRFKKVLDCCKNKRKCKGGDVIDEDQGHYGVDDVKKKWQEGCGALQPKIYIDGMKIIAEYNPRKKSDDQEQLPPPIERKQLLSAERVLNFLNQITDEERQMLGLDPKYALPDWMILQVLPVPPPPDDLTHQLAMIIRHNESIKKQLLQFHFATYFDNEQPGQPRATQRSGRPIKSICSRLKAKEGRIKGNLMGKRVDFSARTVITPDPNIDIDELGVPWSIALNLKYPETVTPYNIERLKELVEYGPYPPPGKTGAKYIIREDGQRLDLLYLKKSSDHHLELGESGIAFLCEIYFMMTSMLVWQDVFMNILMWWEDFDGKVPAPTVLKPRPLWTGKQVFNVIIPKQINLTRHSTWHSESETGFLTPGDTIVRIEKGVVLSGTFCKKTLGTSSGSLIHGFRIGDAIADAATIDIINETISKAKNEVKQLIKAAQDKQLEAEPGLTMMESFETRVNQVLNKARDDAGSSVQKSLSESNNLKAMVTAGSKGSFVNISQMTACVGQQNVEGKRIPYGFDGRTLPHFTKDDKGPESRGFVENSYLRETGYIQRRLVKAMEDIMVKYDGTVRNSLGDVIQFLYGEDGIDAVWIESQKLDSLKMNKKEFENVYKFEIDQENWNPSYMLPEQVDDLKTIREFQKVLDAEFQKLESDRWHLRTEIAPSGDNSWPLPVNLKRLIWNAQKTFKIDPRKPSDMFLMEIVEAIDKLQERLKALVAPGEMIGCVAAQSIGEPATQMTLNTFHYAGVSAKNVTLGVPRLRKIINVAKKIKTPSLSVHLKPEVSKTKERAKSVQCALDYTTLQSVTEAAEVWYDPDPMSTIIEEDVDFVRSYYEKPDEDIVPEKISPWLLRIELNREMMVAKKPSMVDIAEKINFEFDGGLTCIFNDDNAEKLILRIRIMNEEVPIGVA